MKLEMSAMNPKDFTFEATRAIGLATCGAKCTMDTLTTPELGVRFLKGPYFCSLLAKEKFGSYTAHCYYKVSNDIKCAATFDYGGKKTGNFAVGGSYQALAGTLLKAKVLHDQSVHASVKHNVSKGVSCIA